MNIDEIMSLANTYARLIVRGSDEEVHDSYHKLQAAITQHVAEAVAAEREALLDLVDDYAKGNVDLKDAIRARADHDEVKK